jgi:hypothetical protein
MPKFRSDRADERNPIFAAIVGLEHDEYPETKYSKRNQEPQWQVNKDERSAEVEQNPRASEVVKPRADAQREAKGKAITLSVLPSPKKYTADCDNFR